jgi:hypothetical protein
MTTPNLSNADEKPTLVYFVLRVLAPDGHLYEIDGTDFSIAVYPVDYSEQGVVARTSERPIVVMAGTDEINAAVNGVADLIVKTVEAHQREAPHQGQR